MKPNDPRFVHLRAAVACLPLPMQAPATHFIAVRLEGNEKIGDTLVGLFAVLEANGLYMLQMPQLIHDKALVPLEQELDRLQHEVETALNHQRSVASSINASEQNIQKKAEEVLRSIFMLRETVNEGWQQIDTKELARQVRGDLEESLWKPLRKQGHDLENMIPVLREATRETETSIQKLRRFHLTGILLTMAAACLVLFGSIFLWGWWRLHDHYEARVALALTDIKTMAYENETLVKILSALGAVPEVVPVKDDKGNLLMGKFALLLSHADGVTTRRIDDGNTQGVIFFDSLRSEPILDRYVREPSNK